jgi:hypothetical protein
LSGPDEITGESKLYMEDAVPVTAPMVMAITELTLDWVDETQVTEVEDDQPEVVQKEVVSCTVEE